MAPATSETLNLREGGISVSFVKTGENLRVCCLRQCFRAVKTAVIALGWPFCNVPGGLDNAGQLRTEEFTLYTAYGLYQLVLSFVSCAFTVASLDIISCETLLICLQ